MERIGRLTAIYISPEAGDYENPVPMQEVDEVEVIETGLKGDRYSKDGGFWQVADQKRPPEKRKLRGVSGFSREDLEKGNLLNDTNIEPIDTRRNFEIEGVGDIQQLIGRTIQIGETVQIDLTGDCDSCNRPSRLSGKSGYEKHGKLGGVRGMPRKDKLGVVKKDDPVFVI
ncbi:MAG: hypothetical protein HYV90_02200 [Candidatus Woesebacteria bacterium]|nr:MAG: hypothetical protein HYV90_02200 [Candidatus Woesebacteria bacterium]